MSASMENNELKKRMEALDLTYAEVARRVRDIRGKSNSQNLVSIVRKAIDQPETVMHTTLEDVVKALGGQVHVTWIDPGIMRDYPKKYPKKFTT
jgi:hypothetical protein